MAQQSHVPKFGNWETGENVPYTVYFEKARKGRGAAKMINPNDPEENPDLDSLEDAASAQAPPPKAEPESDESKGHGVSKKTHERKISGESEMFTKSPARINNAGGRTPESRHQHAGGRGGSMESQKRPPRYSGGSEHSIERSPLHHQAKISGRGSNSPSWEGKGSRDATHGTPGRSRLGPSRDEFGDGGAAVPKFGGWDESDPASADGYTHIFNKVREERQGVARGGPGVYAESPYAGTGRKSATVTSKGCCFFWNRK